jgi:chitinase
MKKSLSFLLACAFSAQALAAAPRFIYSPYKHLPTPAPQFLEPDNKLAGAGSLSWAFATGECGEEKWGLYSGQQVADANVRAFNEAGIGYVVSTGGEGGVFTCATDEGMERFIARYDSPRLQGLDFDIEANQSAEQVDSLILRIKAAQIKHPQLRYSFTVATHAASDGSNKSLNAQGEAILATLRRHDVRDFTFNLMVMDYGPGTRSVCVLNSGKGGGCDMGKSALQAARNVHRKYGLPMAQLELTPMIGVNDVVENVFTLDDARLLARQVHTMKLAGLHFWSLGRDRPCQVPTPTADARCSSTDAAAGAYDQAMNPTAR